MLIYFLFNLSKLQTCKNLAHFVDCFMNRQREEKEESLQLESEVCTMKRDLRLARQVQIQIQIQIWIWIYLSFYKENCFHYSYSLKIHRYIKLDNQKASVHEYRNITYTHHQHNSQTSQTHRPLTNQINQFSWKITSPFIKDLIKLQSTVHESFQGGKECLQSDRPL